MAEACKLFAFCKPKRWLITAWIKIDNTKAKGKAKERSVPSMRYVNNTSK
jgi:hypothetical protein